MSLNALSIIFSIAIIFAEVFCTIILFRSLISPKSPFLTLSLATGIEFFVLMLFIFFISSSSDTILLKCIFIILLYFCVLQIFYDGTLIKKLFLSIIVYILLLVVDAWSMLLLHIFTTIPLSIVKSDPMFFFLAAIFSKILFFLVVMLIQKLARVKHRPELAVISKYYWFIYILQGILSMIVLLSFLELTYQVGTLSISTIISCLGLLYLNSAIFGILEVAARHNKNEREYALYCQHCETELSNIKLLSQSFEMQSGYLHDYKQQISTIQQLLCKKKYDSALSCLQSITQDVYETLYRFRTNHEIIDAVLNQKYVQAKSKNITLDIRAGDLSSITIKEHLLITILSNAIDNAIEASDKLSSNKIVSIKIVQEEDMLVFSVINAISHPVKIVNNQIETTKPDKLIHGIGLKSIALALSNCNGDYEIICDNRQFQFTALIRLKDCN